MDSNNDWVQDVRRWCANSGPAESKAQDVKGVELRVAIDALRDQPRARRTSTLRGNAAAPTKRDPSL